MFVGSTNLRSVYIYHHISASHIPELLIALSTHMPRLESLTVHCRGSRMETETVNQVTKYLPRFERLAYLVFEYGAERNSPKLVDLDSDRAALQMWANTSPTLRGCNIVAQVKNVMKNEKFGVNYDKYKLGGLRPWGLKLAETRGLGHLTLELEALRR
ncbi:hypothetical protein FB45DRAFT_871799 [Roridomyces roridus]|uniref:Uncharacterized protein n=1 Tax=Roridomyces roridus TaxID=1738132 RepID=A0AAD7BFY9_9AGAR|nr:hypothetical protein FB45DRAFT_871799 [Roridomyces roridus]